MREYISFNIKPKKALIFSAKSKKGNTYQKWVFDMDDTHAIFVPTWNVQDLGNNEYQIVLEINPWNEKDIKYLKANDKQVH